MKHLPNIRLLVTHPGASHRDEWLGCAFILGRLLEQGVLQTDLPPIERRNPTDQDLVDPAVWVLDIGGSHDPAKGNFDHHQFSMEETIKNPRCTFTLVLEHFGLHAEMVELLPWVAYSAAVDCLGREQASAALGIPIEAALATESPIESGMIAQFARLQTLAAQESLHIVMAETGRHLLGQATRLRDRLALLEEQGCELLVDDLRVLLVDVPELSVPQLGLHQFRQRMLQKGIPVDAMILPDSRGPGYILVRLHDAVPLDFRLLRGEPEVGFVHASGFLVQLRERSSRERLVDLFRQALQA